MIFRNSARTLGPATTEPAPAALASRGRWLRGQHKALRLAAAFQCDDRRY